MTNGPIDDPWAVVDAYDDRSWIENALLRNSKQFWTLTRWFPKRTEAGVRTHLTFAVLMMAVATAYRLWDKARTVPSHPASNSTSPQVSYRVIDRESGVITDTPAAALPMPTHLAIGQQYGIFDMYEFLVLSHVPVRKLPLHLALIPTSYVAMGAM